MNGSPVMVRAASMAMAAWISASQAWAAVPQRINYQGALREEGIPVTALRRMRFLVYDAPEGGRVLYDSGEVAVQVSTGIFRYTLLPPESVDWGSSQPYIELRAGTASSNERVYAPREPIASSVFALRASTAEDVFPGVLSDRHLSPDARISANKILGTALVESSSLRIRGPGPHLIESGVVGIGATDGRHRLHVQGTVNSTAGLCIADQCWTAWPSGLEPNGVQANAAQFLPGSPLELRSSSVTLQGNSFNGPKQLLLLSSNGSYPALDGSSILNVRAASLSSRLDLATGVQGRLPDDFLAPIDTPDLVSGVALGNLGGIRPEAGRIPAASLDLSGVQRRGAITSCSEQQKVIAINEDGNVSCREDLTGSLSQVMTNTLQFQGVGTLGSPLELRSSSVTLQGNRFNGPNQLLLSSSNGSYPALDGSSILNVRAASLSSRLDLATGVQGRLPDDFLASIDTPDLVSGVALGNLGGIRPEAGRIPAASLDLSGVQRRGAITSCSEQQKVIAINEDGNVSCREDLTGSLSQVLANPLQFQGVGTLGSPLELLSSSVTLQGNSFNGPGQLVRMAEATGVSIAGTGGGSGEGRYPVGDGSLFSNIQASSLANLGSLLPAAGLIPAANIDPAAIQRRVANTCSNGQKMVAIDQNGNATCQPDSYGLWTGGQFAGGWNVSLTRAGAGTNESPFLLAVNTAHENAWTAPQSFNGGVRVNARSGLDGQCPDAAFPLRTEFRSGLLLGGTCSNARGALIGIGTEGDTPRDELHVKGTRINSSNGGPSPARIRIQGEAEAGWVLQAQGQEWHAGVASGNRFVIFDLSRAPNTTTSGQRLEIDDWGRVTVGAQGNVPPPNGDLLTVYGSLWATGGYGGPSDRRLKKNIEPIAGALDRLLRLRGVTFDWKDPEKYSEGSQMGMIAQEVEQVFPQWVSDGSNGFKAVAYKGFEGLAVEALRELRQRNEGLEARVKTLERRLARTSAETR